MTDETANAALRGCPNPWCDGGSGPYVFSRRRDVLGVCCPQCAVSTPYFATEAEAAAAWNRRAPDPAVSDFRHELAAALIAKLDLVAPKIASDAAFMANRGFVYDGPTYGEELEALRAALSPKAGS
jgi:hypothetical protein